MGSYQKIYSYFGSSQWILKNLLAFLYQHGSIPTMMTADLSLPTAVKCPKTWNTPS